MEQSCSGDCELSRIQWRLRRSIVVASDSCVLCRISWCAWCIHSLWFTSLDSSSVSIVVILNTLNYILCETVQPHFPLQVFLHLKDRMCVVTYIAPHTKVDGVLTNDVLYENAIRGLQLHVRVTLIYPSSSFSLILPFVHQHILRQFLI